MFSKIKKNNLPSHLLRNMVVNKAPSYIINDHNGNPLDNEMPQQNGDAVKLAKQIKFMSNAGRGIIAGYRRGIYNDTNFKVDPMCHDGETQK